VKTTSSTLLMGRQGSNRPANQRVAASEDRTQDRTRPHESHVLHGSRICR
jgi:hypothetical protein